MGTFASWQPSLSDGSNEAPTDGPNAGEIAFNADVAPQPGVTAVGPPSGPSAGGTSVVIRGHDFSGATEVTFGGHHAGFTVDSDDQITAVAPARATTGAVDVTVTALGGTTPISAGDLFTYTPNPPKCLVPQFKGDTVNKARTSLNAAHCTLGIIAKPKHGRGPLVVKSQSPSAGTVLASGGGMSVKLGPKPHHKKHH